MTHRHFHLEGCVVWGYVTDAESLSGEEIFVEAADEKSARALVGEGSWRRLAKRSIGPVELVDPHTTPWPEVKDKIRAIREARDFRDVED